MPKLTLGAVDNIDKPLTLDYELSQPSEEKATSTLYLSPLSEFGISQNPFRRESRSYSVDLGCPTEETVLVNLTLPAGYELAEVPKPAVIELPGGTARFVYSVVVNGSNVQMVSRLNLRNSVYGAEQYADLRELYRLLLARQSEKLIIQKKAGS